MRSRHASLALVAFAVAAAVAAAGGASGKGGAAPPAPPAASPLVVHEWGTFTSVQGSDGVSLEGLQHEEEGLPSFVYSRSEVRDCPLRDQGYKGLEVPATHVTQKMETPVLYFHTQTPRRVRVRVDFVKGLISQWYPVSDLLGPPERSPEDGPLDVSKVERSFLQWDVDLLPKGSEVSPPFPAVAKDDPWAFARDVDAATVRTVPREAPGRIGPTETERFLFYRGLGSFTLPVKVEAAREGRVTFRNEGRETIPFAWSLAVGKGASYRALGPVGAGEAVDASLESPRTMGEDEMAEALKREVAEVLEKHGLFGDEAKAMVETWSRPWFRSEGTRVMYVVPRATADALLPLAIDPTPDSVVRLLVGRLEYLTPEVEETIARALAWRASPDADVRRSAEAVLGRHGRFLEAHVRRVLATATDPVVRKSGEEVLAALK
jgi:hypothetical protein